MLCWTFPHSCRWFSHSRGSQLSMFDYQRVPLNPLVNHNFPLSALPIEDLAPSPNKSIHINSYQVASASDILIWFPFYIKIYHIFHGFLQATNHHHRSPTLHHHHLLRTSSRRPVVPSSPRAPCLMIQGRTLALFQPPAHIFAVRQFVAIEAVVPG